MTARAGWWVMSGAAAASAALVASPRTYEWLRKRSGLQDEDRRYFETPLPDAVEEPVVDTREARLSLRARLAESYDLDERSPGEPRSAPPQVHRAERTDQEPMRRAVDDARGRMRAKARAATTGKPAHGDAEQTATGSE